SRRRHTRCYRDWSSDVCSSDLNPPYLFGGGDGGFFTAPYTGPPFYGEYAGYVGITTLILAITAPLIKRDAQTKFWSVVALVCFRSEERRVGKECRFWRVAYQ